MHRALDSNNLRDALKYSAQMLSELRTSKLSPHKYYELYMQVFDELRKLEMFFKEEARHGGSIINLYELVQHAGNILPRFTQATYSTWEFDGQVIFNSSFKSKDPYGELEFKDQYFEFSTSLLKDAALYGPGGEHATARDQALPERSLHPLHHRHLGGQPQH
ncbi:hypothetical protein ACFX13_002382 [Malus domestica]